MKPIGCISLISLMTMGALLGGCDSDDICANAEDACVDRCKEKYEDRTSYSYKQCISGCEMDYRICIEQESDYD